MRPGNRVGHAALALGGVVLAGFAALRGINPHDEGLMLEAAGRIARGQLPWRDFWWNYGPGEPLVLAGLEEVLGPSLLTWRVLHVLVAAGVALLAFRLVRREAPPAAALAAWFTAAAALSYPLIPNPSGPALLLALGALAAAERPLLAGGLAGTAVAFRLDVGAAAVAAAAIAAWQGPGSSGAGRTAALRALAAGAVFAAVWIVPFALAAGPGRFLDQTIGFALDEQALQRLPLPLDGGGTDDLNKAFEHLFPTLALVALALWTALAAIRWIRGGGPPAGLELSALPLAIAGVLYLLARADEYHVVLLQATLPLLAAPALAGELRAQRLPTAALAAAALALPLLYGLDRKGVQLVHPPELARLRVDVADGVRAEPAEARALSQLVPYVRARVPPGRPVFIANPRHDLVRAGNPLVSVLVRRPNPSAYPIMQPGVVTERSTQREIVRDLERARTRIVVRWSSPVADQREPNGSGESSGVRLLDRYLDRTYRPLRRIGDYLVLERREAG